MRVSVAPVNCVGKLGLPGTPWVYADDDLEDFRLARTFLPPPLISAEVFQQAALDLQVPFTRWVDECMSAMPRHYWLATPLNKNPFDSQLFLHLVWMVLIDRVGGTRRGEVIVVTKSHGLALALGALCRIRGWEFQHFGKMRHLLQRWLTHSAALVKWLGKLILLSGKAVMARCVFSKGYVEKKLVAADILLETYIHDGDMSEDGCCSDRYLPGLMAYYQARGVKAAYFPMLHRIPLSHLWQTYLSMKRSNTPFVLFEAFVTFRDIFQAAWVSLRHGLSFRLQMPLIFQGVPVDALVREDCFVAGLRSLIPAVLARTPRRMAEAGVKPKWFIDWFENQSLDKGVVLGFTEGVPECRPIAVRQYVFFGNFLSLFSTSEEVKSGVAPAENWVCGESLQKMFSRFDTLGRYSVVPALRYAHLRHYHPVITEGDALLVLLTHSLEESMSILDCVAPLCKAGGVLHPRLIVKVHPDMNLLQFRKKAEQRFPALVMNAVEWTLSKVSELFPIARVTITSGSSAAVEAVCRGIPVILVGRQAGLNFNPLEGIDSRMWGIAYTSNDLEEAVAQRFSKERLPDAERLAIAENTRNAFFMKTGDDEMRRFLPMKQRD